MPLYLVRWPDLSASLVDAADESDLIYTLDQVANPDGCRWSIYDGPLFVDVTLPVRWSIADDAAEPLSTEDIVIDDMSAMLDRPVLESMELTFASADTGLDAAEAILEAAFPTLHHAAEDADLEMGPSEEKLRAALQEELRLVAQQSWRQENLARQSDPVSVAASVLDLPVELARRHLEHEAAAPDASADLAGQLRGEELREVLDVLVQTSPLARLAVELATLEDPAELQLDETKIRDRVAAALLPRSGAFGAPAQRHDDDIERDIRTILDEATLHQHAGCRGAAQTIYGAVRATLQEQRDMLNPHAEWVWEIEDLLEQLITSDPWE